MLASIKHGSMATTLHKGRTTLGRQIGLKIRLFEDPKVSRTHCVFVWNGSELSIENLSENGTLVNGVEITEAVRLQHGDTVRVGDTDVVVDLTDDAQSIESPTSYA